MMTRFSAEHIFTCSLQWCGTEDVVLAVLPVLRFPRRSPCTRDLVKAYLILQIFPVLLIGLCVVIKVTPWWSRLTREQSVQ